MTKKSIKRRGIKTPQQNKVGLTPEKQYAIKILIEKSLQLRRLYDEMHTLGEYYYEKGTTEKNDEVAIMGYTLETRANEILNVVIGFTNMADKIRREGWVGQ